MANIKRKLQSNIEGQYYVDNSCINCDACRKFAPKHFSDSGEFSYVEAQPTNRKEELAVQRALLSCPTNSIGMLEKENLKEARDTLPLLLKDNIYVCGHNDRSSFGAETYFIKSTKGNWLVDGPSFNKDLCKKFHALGGLKYIYLTHRDDVADAHKWAREFNASRIIHEGDLIAQKDSEIVLSGSEDTLFDEGRVIYTPGHTRGHTCLLYRDKYLFTGDHFCWLKGRGEFGAFEDYCWFDWEMQKQSILKLANYPNVESIFPGHGRRREIEKGDFPRIIKAYYQNIL